MWLARLIAYDVLAKLVREREIGKARSQTWDWQGSLPTMCLARLGREREIGKVTSRACDCQARSRT